VTLNRFSSSWTWDLEAVTSKNLYKLAVDFQWVFTRIIWWKELRGIHWRHDLTVTGWNYPSSCSYFMFVPVAEIHVLRAEEQRSPGHPRSDSVSPQRLQSRSM
jgi:hypothetical protein